MAQRGTFNQGNLPYISSILPINLILGIIQHKYQTNIMLEDNISILFFHYLWDTYLVTWKSKLLFQTPILTWHAYIQTYTEFILKLLHIKQWVSHKTFALKPEYSIKLNVTGIAHNRIHRKTVYIKTSFEF